MRWRTWSVLSKSLGVRAFRCSSLNTISIWSSQEALTGSQWRWTVNGSFKLVSHAGKRLGACVEPLSRMRCRLRIRRHHGLPKSSWRKLWNSTKRLRSKQRAEGAAGVHQQAGEQLHGASALIAIGHVYRAAGVRGRCASAGLPGLDGGLLIRADDHVALPGQRLGALVERQDRDGPFQEARVSRPLPAVVLPGLDAVGPEPALDGRA